MVTNLASAVYIGIWVALIGYTPMLVDYIFLYPGVPVFNRGGIVVTGASTGIGRDAALHLAEQGYTVYGGVRKQSDADALKKLGGNNIIPVILDVSAVGARLEAPQKNPFLLYLLHIWRFTS